MEGACELDSLITILDGVRATDFLLLVEPSLVSLLSNLAPYSTLKQHGVEALVPLNEQAAQSKQTNARALVYITTATPKSLALVSKSAKNHIGLPITIVVTPEIPPSTKLIFSQSGILGDVELVAWPTSLVPDALTPDLLTLLHTESNTQPASGVWPLVWALDSLQSHVTGAFGKVTSVGQRAHLVAKYLDQKRAEDAVVQQKFASDTNFAEYHFGYSSATFFGAEVEHAIIVDRDLDLVTPLLCQTTYEGVLAETVGLSASGTSQVGMKVSLRNDPVFSSIAETGFAEACDTLHKNAKDLQQQYRAKNTVVAGGVSGVDLSDSSKVPSITEIREVVSKLGSLQATQRVVNTHTELASLAMADLERRVRHEAFEFQMRILEGRISNAQAVAQVQDLIFQQAPLSIVLRLLSLLCLVRGGLKESALQALLYGDILKTYGYEHLSTLHYLYERGLIFSPKGSSFLFSASPLVPFGLGSGSSPSNAASGTSAAATSANRGNGTAGSFSSALQSSSTVTITGNPQKPSGIVTGGGSSADIGELVSHKYPWQATNKSYKMFPSESEEAKPYAGIVPLTARIAQMALNAKSKTKTPLEPEFVERVYHSKDSQSAREAKLRRTLLRNSKNNSGPIVLVVIVGGVTYAETTAIKRALGASNENSRPRHVIVASTSVLTGNDLVKIS